MVVSFTSIHQYSFGANWRSQKTHLSGQWEDPYMLPAALTTGNSVHVILSQIHKTDHNCSLAGDPTVMMELTVMAVLVVMFGCWI